MATGCSTRLAWLTAICDTPDSSHNGPSGTLEFNFNDPSTRVRFTSTNIITYDLSSSGSGDGSISPRLDRTPASRGTS